MDTVKRGMRIDAPRSATPHLKLSIEFVSQFPVSRRSLPCPYVCVCACLFAWPGDMRTEERIHVFTHPCRICEHVHTDTHKAHLAVQADVLLVVLAELLASILDDFVPTVIAHLLRREVHVAARAVPVVGWNRLRVEGAGDACLLTNAVEQEARHVHVVAGLDARAGAHLVFPLTGHHLAVDAADVEARIQAQVEMLLADQATKGNVRAHGAVVGALRTRVAELKHRIRAAVEGARRRLGPAHGAAVFKEGVLLLDAIPRLLVKRLLEDGVGHRARRLLDGGHVRAEHLAQHEDVVALTHGVLAHECGLEEDLGIVAGCLAGGRAVVVPQGQLFNRGRHLVEDAGLGTVVVAATTATTNPDVFGLDLAVRVRLEAHGPSATDRLARREAAAQRGNRSAGGCDGPTRKHRGGHEGLGTSQSGGDRQGEVRSCVHRSSKVVSLLLGTRRIPPNS